MHSWGLNTRMQWFNTKAAHQLSNATHDGNSLLHKYFWYFRTFDLWLLINLAGLFIYMYTEISSKCAENQIHDFHWSSDLSLVTLVCRHWKGNVLKYLGIRTNDKVAFIVLIDNKSRFPSEVREKLVQATFLPVIDCGDMLFMRAESSLLDSYDHAGLPDHPPSL